MDSVDASQDSKELSQYVLSAFFPECVTVADGKHIAKSVQIRKGDIIVLKSCDAKVVTLSYRDEVNGKRKSVTASSDRPEKFVVLPPKESVSSRTASVIMYPSVADLLIDSPTYFEATSSYDDESPYGTSIHRGDRFRYRGVIISPADGQKRLKVLDEEGNLNFLGMDCRGNFYPLEDDYCYTLKELLTFAPVPRRLKLVDQKMQKNSSKHSIDKPDSSSDPSKKDTITDTSCLPHESFPFSSKGVLHMLKPEVSVTVSPLNDPDTLWTIPVDADILVQQYILDDYEVPSAVIAKKTSMIIPTEPPPLPEVEDVPNFPAPPTPQLSQPLIPIKVNNFLDIYGSSFPVKAKIMDVSECSSYYKTALCDCSDLTIHRVENTKRLYAKDSKTDTIFSLSKDAKVSFLEYPQKFNYVSELVNLPSGTKVVVLEDIASDYPKTFSLQFGDVIRISSNVPALMKVKHTNIECKILKCERMNDDNKGSVTKIKLPLDFEIKMMISTDHNGQKVISMQELLSGEIPLPSGDVAVLIENEKDSVMKDLPPNLGDLQILPERLLMASFDMNAAKNSGDVQYETIGISLNSGLVLAFRQRLKASEADKFVSRSCVVQQEMEILTLDEYEDRKQKSSVQTEEDNQDIESVSSSDKQSVSGDSLQRTNSASALETKKKKEGDKIRRLSRALNPKKWRPAKAVPDPLPHPEAMGLMALAVRPHYEKPNDYLTDTRSSASTSLDQTWSSFGGSSDEENEKNIYEDVVVRPFKQEPQARRKAFAGPFHKSLPLPRRFAKARKEKARSHAIGQRNDMSDGGKPKARDLSGSSFQEKEGIHLGKRDNYEDDDDMHIYECPDGGIDSDPSSSSDLLHRNKINKHLSEAFKQEQSAHHNLSQDSPSYYVQPQLEVKPTNTVKSNEKKNVIEETNDKTDPVERDEKAHRLSREALGKSTSIDPPVPPRRTKKLDSTSRNSSTDELSSSASQTFVAKSNDNALGAEDLNKENLATARKSHDNDSKIGKPAGNVSTKPPVPKPRGVKKRVSSNLTDNSVDREKDSRPVQQKLNVSHPMDNSVTKVEESRLKQQKSNVSHASDNSVAKEEESQLKPEKTDNLCPSVVQDKTGNVSAVKLPPPVVKSKPVRDLVKPKPPPKPRLKP